MRLVWIVLDMLAAVLYEQFSRKRGRYIQRLDAFQAWTFRRRYPALRRRQEGGPWQSP